MRKSIICLVALLIGAASLSAQDKAQQSNKTWISIQGGGLVSLNENYASYGDNGKNADLLTGQGSAAIGHMFSPVHGMRLWAGYGNNRSACNTKETSAHGFYPYKFNSINVFVDYILDFNGFSDSPKSFAPKAYLGVGLGNTSNFVKAEGNQAPGQTLHPWQTVSEKNNALGFRAGLILEYMVSNSFGILADLGGEFYTDDYNGMNSGKEVSGTGDKNFPLDFRGVASLGVAIHF